MEKLDWKQDSWSSRNYTVTSFEALIGRLSFKGWSSYDADYTSGNSSLAFRSKGWLEQEVTIRYNGEVVGIGRTSALGKTTITLVTGEQYDIRSKTFSLCKSLIDDAGNTVVRFSKEGISGGKGTIEVEPALPELTKMLLCGTSLYFKTVADSQMTMLIAIFIPIFLQAIR